MSLSDDSTIWLPLKETEESEGDNVYGGMHVMRNEKGTLKTIKIGRIPIIKWVVEELFLFLEH